MKKSGFTLAELTIAAIILILALGGLLTSFTGNFGLIDSGRSLTVAMNHARCVMEEIRDVNIPDLVTLRDWTGWAQRPITDPNGGGGCNTLSNESVQVSFPSGTQAEPLQVLVTVNWTEKGRSRSASLVTLLAER